MSDYNLQQEVSDKYSLRGRVFHKIREDILNGKYKQNEELREATIGAELGVSKIGRAHVRTHLSEKHSGSLNSKDF